MRILLTVHQFLPDYSAGTEILTLELARELVRRGHTVRIFAGFPGRPEQMSDKDRFDRYEFEGIPVDRFTHAFVPMGGANNVARVEYDNPLVASHIENIVREFKPDLVHAYHLARLSTSVIDVCDRAVVPVIFTATDFWFVCPLSQLLLADNRLCGGPSKFAGNCIKHLAMVEKPTALRRALNVLPDWLVGAAASMIHKGLFPPTPHNAQVRAVVDRKEFIRGRLNKARQIIAPSKTMKEMLLHNGIDPHRIIHLPYGIDYSRIHIAAGKGRGERLRVGFIGTLAPHKGAHILIQAARQIPELPIDFILHGTGPANSPYPSELRALAGGDSRIQIRGGFGHERISEILSELDVLVVPSIWRENTPLVVQEAQAAGCAVVASDVDGISELIRDGLDGLLFPAGDSGALAGHLSGLCADRAKVAQFTSATRPPMTLAEHVDRLEAIYLKKN